MGKFDELEKKIVHYRWLKDIASNYQSMIELIEKEKDYYIIYGIKYTARGDARNFQVNPHRPIPNKYILEGLRDALDGINKEIEECERELGDWL